MPFVPRYRDLLDSKCADLNNTATKGKGGGAITAAVFLKEFVDKVRGQCQLQPKSLLAGD